MLFAETPRKQNKIRKDPIMRQGYTITILRTKPDNTILINGKCPSCKAKIAYYSNGERKNHLCTVCGEEVYL